MKHHTLRAAVALFAALVFLSACRNDEYVVPSETVIIDQKPTPSVIVGMYVLNEGNMGSNKASLDFLDLSGNQSTLSYTRNIYAERNPTTVKELGDVGNDLKIYGEKMWMVINASNKVEVVHAKTCKRIGQINIPNARYVSFDKQFAYVTSYVGPIAIDGNAPLGRVYKIDTLTLSKVDSITVGYQPEEMAVVNNQLLVANSGGYRVPNYDDRVTVVDLNTFKPLYNISVARNLHRCKADGRGNVWVTSRGNYMDEQPKLFCLSKDAEGRWTTTATIDRPVSDFALAGDSLYFYGVNFNYATGKNTIDYGLIDINTRQPIATQLFSATQLQQVEMPYGLAVNPLQRDFYIMDAKNFVSSGELLHFLPDGTFHFRVKTGDIPAHAAFLYQPLKP